MGLQAANVITTALVTAVVAGGIFAWWLASRRRIAEETIGRARTEAERVTRQAERDAETLLKEAAIAAREKAHELSTEGERQMRERRQEIIGLEATLADKTRALADRLAATDRLEQRSEEHTSELQSPCNLVC